MSNFEVIAIMIIMVIALIALLSAINWVIERIRDRLHPERTQPVVFDRYKTKVYDQERD